MINIIKKMGMMGMALAVSLMFISSANAMPITPNELIAPGDLTQLSDVSSGGTFIFDGNTSNVSPILTYTFDFTATGALPQPASALDLNILFGPTATFTEGLLQWVETGTTNVLSFVELGDATGTAVVEANLATVFTSDNPLQSVILSFATLTGNIDVNLSVQAVPITPTYSLKNTLPDFPVEIRQKKRA